MLYAVADHPTGITAFVFFEAGAGVQRVVNVDKPCLLMTRKFSANELILSVADPVEPPFP